MSDEDLTPVQRLVLSQSWAGASYAEIAESHGYDHDYIRRVGSGLWRELSRRLGVEVTKRNLPEIVGGLVPNVMLAADDKPPFPGGPMAPGSPFYMIPPELDQAFGEIEQPGGLVRIKAPAKTGKTSAALQLLERAGRSGLATVFVDLTRVENDGLADIDRFLRWLSASIGNSLGLETRIDDYWSDQIGCKVSCAHYLEDHILGSLEAPVLIVLDGVERLFEHPLVASEFLPFVRSCFEEARHRPEMGRIRWVLAYSTEVYVPIDVRHSPFNVGFPLSLPDFDVATVQRLAQAYGLNWDTPLCTRHAQLLAEEVNGHPFLVQRTLYELAVAAARANAPLLTLDRILEASGPPDGIFSAHLERLLAILEERPELSSILVSIINGSPDCSNPVGIYKLEALGLVHRTAVGVEMRCSIYDRFFGDRLG